MQGPQAFARTVPPNLRRVSACVRIKVDFYASNISFLKNYTTKYHTMPSLSIVARICSEPGVTLNAAFAVNPCSNACLAMLAQRPMSSYELLVHEPIKPTLISLGHPSFLAVSPKTSTDN